MSTIIQAEMAIMLAELAQSVEKIIDKHWEENNTIHHHGPFRFELHGVDGHIATFLEEGISLYPEEGNR